MKISQMFSTCFAHNEHITYPCPSCGKISLKVNIEKFKREQTETSIWHAKHTNMSPDDYYHASFTGILQCENKLCRAIVSCIGDAYVSEDEFDYNSQEMNYTTYYNPKLFIPALKFIDIPEKCPYKVSFSLQEAFTLTFVSPSSAANKVRAAIENLLEEQFAILPYKLNGDFITLANRLKEFDTKYSQQHYKLHEMFNAIRWIGNEGSHGLSSLTHTDIFDAYEFMEYVLNEIYQPDSQIHNKVESRIKNKGK